MVLATNMRRALLDVSTARFQLKVWWASVWSLALKGVMLADAHLALAAADCWPC
jgi:hypothetical protein